MKLYYVPMDQESISGAVTLVQINENGGNRMLCLLEAAITNDDSETSQQLAVQILRVTTAGTGTSTTPVPVEVNQSAATFTATTDHTAEGTASTVYLRDGFNVLNGWRFQPTPEGRIWVPPSGRLAIKLATAPGAAINLNAWALVGEVG